MVQLELEYVMYGIIMLGRIAKRTSEILEGLSFWPPFAAMLGMIIIVFAGVAMRFIGQPLPFVEEYSAYLQVTISFLALSYVLKRKTHISVSIVPDALRPSIRARLEILTLLISLVVIVLLFVSTIILVVSSFKTGRTSWSVMETPLAPVQLLMPIGLGLFILQIIDSTTKKVKSLLSPK